MNYIEKGTLSYFQFETCKPLFFSYSRSKNIAFKLSKGSVLVCVNADHYLEKGFVAYVEDAFSKSGGFALIPDLSTGLSDNFGRICVSKNDFLRVGGFDERFVGYGYEDIDLIMRLKLAGVRIKYFDDRFCFRYVKHKDQKRVENSYDYKNIFAIHVERLEKSCSQIFYMYKDNTVEYGIIRKSHHDIPILDQAEFSRAQWKVDGSSYILNDRDGIISVLNVDEDFNHENGNWRIIQRDGWKGKFEDLIMQKSLIENYRRLIDRKENGNFFVPTEATGSIIFRKNFRSKLMFNL